jgi:hypothetical protein
MAVNRESASQADGKPQAVRGTAVLLTLQGSIWGLVCLTTFFWTSPSLAGQYGAGQAGITLLLDTALAGFASGSFCLAWALRRPSRRARLAAIALEGFMTVFGLVILAGAGALVIVTDGPSTQAQPGSGGPLAMVALAGLIGAALSSASVHGMLSSAARDYCAPPSRSTADSAAGRAT